MANYEFKVGDVVHHSTIKPAKGYDCFIAGFSEDGNRVVLGNVDRGHDGFDEGYLYDETGVYRGKALLNSRTRYWFGDVKNMRKLDEKIKDPIPKTTIIEDSVKSKTTLLSSSKTIKVDQNF